MEQREIKYRLHDKDGNVIGYEYHERNEFNCYQIYHTSLRGDWKGVGESEKKLVREGFQIAATYKCAFTGLNDKNGVEIYEGDIVRFIDAMPNNSESGNSWEDELCTGAIWFDTEAGRWECTNRLSIDIDQFIEEISNVEVIGNIYTTPHLLTPNQNLNDAQV